MTVSTQLNRTTQTGNGTTKTVPVSFPFQNAADLIVLLVVIATDVPTTQTLGTHYTIGGTPNALGHYANGGSVEMLIAPSTLQRVVVYRDPARTQSMDLVNNDSLPAESVEAAIDYQTMLIQRVADLIGRSLRQPDGDSANITTLPSKVSRASLYAGYDANGDPAALSTPTGTSITTAFSLTLLDDANAATARQTLGFPAGTNGDMFIVDSSGALGIAVQPLRPVSLAPNPVFSVDQLALSLTSTADDVYGHDHWYALTQTAAIQLSTQTLQEDGYSTNARLTQNQAAAQRMGYACILSANVSQRLRGQTVLLNPRVRISAAQSVKAAILEWTGAADAVTSDIVNDWTSTDYTDGAAKFFVDANLTPLGNSVINSGANAWADCTLLPVTVGSSCNNVILFIWTTGTAAQTVALDISEVRLCFGTYKGRIHVPTFHETLQYAQRYYQKSFKYGTAPAQNVAQAEGAHFAGQCVGASTIMGCGSSRFPVVMRANPTITTYNPNNVNAQMRNITTGVDCSATSTTTGESAVEIITTTPAGSAAGNRLYVHWTADARL